MGLLPSYTLRAHGPHSSLGFHVLFLLKLSVSPTPLLVSQKQELDVTDYCTFHKMLAHGLMQEATCRGRNTVALGVRQCWV